MAQTRELVCTKIVLPQVVDRGKYLERKKLLKYTYGMYIYSLFIGLDIREVAHDCQTQLSRYVTSELKLLNSYNTWHGKLH